MLSPNEKRHLWFPQAVTGSKDAIGKDLYTEPLSYERILPLIEVGGNYGVICGSVGIGTIDVDHIEEGGYED